MDKPNPLVGNAVDRNSGLAERQTFGARSREMDMIGRIHADLFLQERYILNEVNAKIKLIRSNDAFCLMATGDPAILNRYNRGVVTDTQSQNQSFCVPGTRENAREEDGEVSHSTRDLQDIHGSGRVLGCESRETVFGSTAGQNNSRSCRQQSLQQRAREKSIQFPTFFADGNRNLLGRTIIRR
jgi:hypothetical protein